MVIATVGVIMVITRTPRKLKKAESNIAERGFNARVAMAVAIALGASVQPLTNITPSVSIIVMNRAGLPNSWETNHERLRSTLFHIFVFIFVFVCANGIPHTDTTR